MITLGQFFTIMDPETKIVITNEEGYPIPLTKEDTVSSLTPRSFEEMDTSYIVPLLDLEIKNVSHCSGSIRITVHIASI